jgi:hypothetical protein
MKLILLALLFALPARAAIVERRIWIEKAINSLKDDLCKDSVKQWRCLFPDRAVCVKAMQEAFVPCSSNVIPDLPEYIDSPETKAQAEKVVTACLATELGRKHILALPREKLDEYNVCTGAMARTKPLNPRLLKALDYSKTLTAGHCSDGSYFRRCYGLSEKDCKDTREKQSLECTMKLETEGQIPKDQESAIQDSGRKITECLLAGMRKELDGKKKKSKAKDCE